MILTVPRHLFLSIQKLVSLKLPPVFNKQVCVWHCKTPIKRFNPLSNNPDASYFYLFIIFTLSNTGWFYSIFKGRVLLLNRLRTLKQS